MMRLNKIAIFISLVFEDVKVRLRHGKRAGVHSYRVQMRQHYRHGEWHTELPMEAVCRVILEDKIRELPFEQRALARVAWRKQVEKRQVQQANMQAILLALQETQEMELLEQVERYEREKASKPIPTKIIPFPCRRVASSSAREAPTTPEKEEVKKDEPEAVQKQLEAVVRAATSDPGHQRQLLRLFLDNPELAKMALSKETTLRFCMAKNLRSLQCCGAMRKTPVATGASAAQGL